VEREQDRQRDRWHEIAAHGLLPLILKFILELEGFT
jgi:hypothetical protein